METQERKCVLVLDESLPAGVLANTAAILGITLGRQVPEVVGEDVTDGSGHSHLGIITFPVPVLRAGPEQLRRLREKLYEPDVAQSCRTYEEFLDKAAGAEEESLRYYGLGLCGPKKQVNRLTGSLPLLR